LRVHHRKFFAFMVFLEYECSDRSAPPMDFDRRGYIYIGNDLSVDNEKCVVLEVITGMVKRSGGTENIRKLARVMYPYIEIAAVAENVDDRIRLMMQVYDHVRAAEFRDVFRNIAD